MGRVIAFCDVKSALQYYSHEEEENRGEKGKIGASDLRFFWHEFRRRDWKLNEIMWKIGLLQLVCSSARSRALCYSVYYGSLLYTTREMDRSFRKVVLKKINSLGQIRTEQFYVLAQIRTFVVYVNKG